jgi:nucleoside-diphosphate-sugar epimerase
MTVDFCVGSPATLNEFASRVARIFGHTFELLHEGESPEYIRFRASPDGMAEALGVRAEITLDEGMKRLDAWLRRTDLAR